jgi:hypothetical protein
MGADTVWGVIAEDHGVVGGKRRHLYKVLIPDEPHEPLITVRSADTLEPDRVGDEPITKADVIEYFKRGAFRWMMNQAQDQPGFEPRVWLCRDVLGGMTFTFNPERGMVGGVPVPAGLVDPYGRLRKERREDVLQFLTGFGLTGEEARAVLGAAKNGR